MAGLTAQEKQQILEANEFIKAGKFRQALDLIDGIRHPKVDQLRQQIVKAYRAQIANEVSPPKLSSREFKPSEPILLLDEADNPQPPSGQQKTSQKPSNSRWKIFKKWWTD